ncbi:MAG TPA: hypothetical protein PKA58_11850 [Polyangium sp.]|nr:hypothetical protein [Polyangium sp.]
MSRSFPPSCTRQTRLATCVFGVLANLATACATTTPLQQAGNGANFSTRPLEVAADASVTDIHASSPPPTDTRPREGQASNPVVVAADSSAPAPVAAANFVCPDRMPAPRSSLGTTTSHLFSRISPADHWTCLNATVTGLLVTSSLAVPILSWSGFAIAAPAQPVTSGEYLFARNDDGFRALYFAIPNGKNPLNLQVSGGDGKPYSTFSSMLDPQIANPWKLVNAAHIVRLRVNNGLGAGGGLHFIASDVEVLDKTKEVPLDPTAVLSGFLTPLATETSPEGKRWREQLVAAITQKMKKDPTYKSFGAAVPQDQYQAGFHATWDEKAEELRVGFYASLTQTLSREAPNPDPHAGGFNCYAPPGADCAPRHIPATITVSLMHRGEYAVRATFSKTGALVKREELPIEVH